MKGGARRACAAASILAAALATAAAGAAPPKRHPLQASVDAILDPLPGSYAYVIRDLDAGVEIARSPDTPFPLASAAKAFVVLTALAEMERGRLRLQDRVAVTSDLAAPPSGILQDFDPGLEPTVRDLLRLSVSRSDNTAADVLTRRVGVARVQEVLDSIGLRRSEFVMTNRAMFLLSMGLGKALPGPGPAARTARWRTLSAEARGAAVRQVEEEFAAMPYDELWERFLTFYRGPNDPWRDAAHVGFVAAVDNKSTAREMAELYTRMARGDLMSAEISRRMVDLLATHDTFGAEDDLDLPHGVNYAHKGGTDAGIRTECGVFIDQHGRAIVIALMGQGFVELADVNMIHPVDQALLEIQRLLLDRIATPPATIRPDARP